jgi:hypothetical protein
MKAKRNDFGSGLLFKFERNAVIDRWMALMTRPIS